MAGVIEFQTCSKMAAWRTMARCCRWGGRTQCKSWTTTSSPRWWQTRWMCAGSTMEASLRFRSSSGSRSRLWRIWASRATSRSGRQTLRRSLTCCCTVRVALALLLHVDRPELGLAHPKTRLKMLNMLRALLLLLALLLHGHMLLDGAGGHGCCRGGLTCGLQLNTTWIFIHNSRSENTDC